MYRPPRNPRNSLLGGTSLVMSILQGISVPVIVLGVYVVAMLLNRGKSRPEP